MSVLLNPDRTTLNSCSAVVAMLRYLQRLNDGFLGLHQSTKDVYLFTSCTLSHKLAMLVRLSIFIYFCINVHVCVFEFVMLSQLKL